MTRHLSLTAAALIAFLPFASAAPVKDDDPQVTAALQKGVAHLKARQDPDGSFKDEWYGKDYKSGETALALLALLKAGVDPGDPAIERGFNWLLAQPHKRIYCVSVAILALEARYTPERKASIDDDKPLKSQIRKRFKKKSPDRDRRWLGSAVDFLSAHQDPGGYWRYPSFGDLDLSNTQFAVLALKAAQRMGAKVDPEIYVKTAAGLLKYQEAQGPDVTGFAVPAADRPIAGLLDKREKLRQAKERASRASSKGSRTRDADETELATQTRTPMRARGWGYKPGDGPRGSMTAAGLAVLVVCKSELEGNKVYDRQMGPQVDRSLRDGAGWMASRFRVDRNPGAENDWLFYYLYTLERAGTLLALNRFADRDWYAEGRQVILGAQQADGRFHVDTGGQGDGELAATCFAILFLKRSTVPVMKRPMTGGDIHTGSTTAASTTPGGPRVTRRPDGQLDVTFSYTTGPGQRVTVAGSFNGWSKDAHVMQESGGTYTLTVTLPAGRHAYKFVINGSDWRHDPANPKSEPDGHSGQNSIFEG